MGYAGLPSKSPLSNNGLQLSETVLMHAGVGAEAGYDTNVFYGDKGHTVGSPIVRVVPYIEFTNATRSGDVPSGVYFDLDLSATYRQYLSNDPQPNNPAKKVSDQNEFLPGVSGLLEFSSPRAVSFQITDTFSRIEEAPYMLSMNRTSGPLIRYINAAAAQLRWAPGGGRVQAILRYDNTYETFPSASHLEFADSIYQQGSIDLSWKWLPKTAIFVKVSQGYVSYLNGNGGTPDTTKYSSYPFRAAVGLRGLVTQKTSVNVWVGYSNAFYANGRNPEGLAGHLNASADLSIRPTMLNALGISYRHDFQNSVIGNFYNIDGVSAWFQQMLASRVSLLLSVRYEHRDFQFTNGERIDNYIQAGAAADFHPKTWAYVGVGYAALYNDANQPDNAVVPVGATYVKHQIFGRLGVTY